MGRISWCCIAETLQRTCFVVCAGGTDSQPFDSSKTKSKEVTTTQRIKSSVIKTLASLLSVTNRKATMTSINLLENDSEYFVTWLQKRYKQTYCKHLLDYENKNQDDTTTHLAKLCLAFVISIFFIRNYHLGRVILQKLFSVRLQKWSSLLSHPAKVSPTPEWNYSSSEQRVTGGDNEWANYDMLERMERNTCWVNSWMRWG